MRDGGFDLDFGIARHAGTGRNELADDDILFQTDQRIRLALDSGVGEHACGLLEGSRGQEAVGSERRLGDTEQKLGKGGGAQTVLAFCDALFDLLVLKEDVVLVVGLTGQEVGAACVVDLDLAHHLTDNDLDVLVVDLNTLQTVGGLYLGNEVVVDRLCAQNTEDIVRIDRTVGELVALLDSVAVHDLDAETEGDQIAALPD